MSPPRLEQKSRTVWEVFEEERPSLQALPPRAFDGYRRETLRASPTSLIRFDRNRYRVEARAPGRVVELRSYADPVRVYFENECVADHRRLFGRDQTVFDPWHYLPVLQRKPGALRNGAPFKDWALPVAIERTLERLKSYRDWDRQSVDILSMVPVYGLETVAGACDQALLSGSVTRDRVLNLLSRANEEEVPEPIETPAHLELREPPLAIVPVMTASGARSLSMARAEVLELMKELRLIGMPVVYDEVLAQARKRRQSAEAMFETLLEAEAGERRARSIRYRMGQAHFPLQCDLEGFEFGESRVDETQLRTLYEGEFITELRNLIFIGGTGTGKTIWRLRLPCTRCVSARGFGSLTSSTSPTRWPAPMTDVFQVVLGQGVVLEPWPRLWCLVCSSSRSWLCCVVGVAALRERRAPWRMRSSRARPAGPLSHPPTCHWRNRRAASRSPRVECFGKDVRGRGHDRRRWPWPLCRHGRPPRR